MPNAALPFRGSGNRWQGDLNRTFGPKSPHSHPGKPEENRNKGLQLTSEALYQGCSHIAWQSHGQGSPDYAQINGH